MSQKIKLSNYNLLYNEYVINNKNIEQLSKEYNCRKESIKNWVKKHNIQIKCEECGTTNVEKSKNGTQFICSKCKHIKKSSTKKNRYGDKNYCNPEKIKKTKLKKYGTTFPFIGSTNHFSKISQELFWEIYNKLSYNLKEKTYFGELNKEFGVKSKDKYYFYDFVISNIKFCIEFNGDYWHKDTKETDRIKNQVLEKKGFQVIVIWESEYKENKNAIIKNCTDRIKVI